MIRHLAILVLPLLLAACVNLGSGTAPSRHYLVPSLLDAGSAAPAEARRSFRVSARLPAYLDRPELQLRRDAARVEPFDFDRWAEPPAEMIARVVAENLSVLGLPARADGRLQLEVHRFEGTAEGAQVQLDWRYAGSDGKEVLSGSFRRLVPVTPVTPEGLVRAFGMLLTDFSRELATQLAQQQ